MKLIDKQIENWRNVLLGMIGPYALIMPKEEIEKLADTFQKRMDEYVQKEMRNDKTR